MDDVATPGSPYSSVFLDSKAPHLVFFGWKVVYECHGLRVLEKRRGPFVRSLALFSNADGPTAFDRWCTDSINGSATRDIVIHDFVGQADVASRRFGGRPFNLLRGSGRLLNAATFVLDLRQSPADLLQAMTADYRRKIRRAEQSGVRVSVYDTPSEDLLVAFAAAYASMATANGLNAFDSASLRRMYAQKRALLFVAETEGQMSNFLHVYLGTTTGLFMYGVNPIKDNSGVGHLLQWRAIEALRERGYQWYDMGGVPSLDPSNGIFTFKARFGGELVKLGAEWRFSGVAVRAILKLRRYYSSVGRERRGESPQAAI